jgi:hypothetical protein
MAANPVRVAAVVVLICTAVVTSLALTNAGIGADWADGFYLACWISIAGSALSVYLARPLGLIPAVILALNAGVYGGAIGALNEPHWQVYKGFLGTAVLLPAGWAARRNLLLPLKVVASWFVAIAALAAVLQFLPVTPGYLPDHVE